MEMTIKKEPSTTFVQTKTVARKVFGIPLYTLAIAILVLGGTATAAVLVANGMIYNVNVPSLLTTNMTGTINAYGSDVYTYAWSLQDRSNQPLNFTMKYAISPTSTLSDGEVRIQILNGTGNIISDVQTPIGNVLTASWIDIPFNSLESKSGTLKIQFAINATNETYYSNLSIEQGSWGWSI